MTYSKRVYGTPAERLAAKYAVDSETGCWNWTAGTSGGGGGDHLAHVVVERTGE